MIHAVKFTSVIGPAIARFVALKQALGRQYNTQCQHLVGLDRFLATRPVSDLTAESFSARAIASSHIGVSGQDSYEEVLVPSRAHST